MAAMRRKLVWDERQNFQGWICNECAWVFKPSGTITGRSLDEMKGELRAAARPEVQISCLYRAPESHKKSRLAKSLAGQMRGSRVPQGSCPSKQERADEGEGEGRSGAARYKIRWRGSRSGPGRKERETRPLRAVTPAWTITRSRLRRDG